MTVLKTENLGFSYGSHNVLDSISLEINEGQFVSLLGSNGAGKSTMFKCMLGLLPGYTGDVYIRNRNIRQMTVRDIAGEIAYIPQHTAPAFNYSVEDIVLMGTTAGLRAFSEPKQEEMDRVDEALSRVGIENLRERCFHLLSGGEKQLAVIARALAQNARILMLDEPTSALDFANQMRVLKQVRALADEGYTIIQTSHNPEHSYMFSDRIIALKDGGILADGNPRDIMREDIISELYGTDVKISSLFDDRVRVCTDMF